MCSRLQSYNNGEWDHESSTWLFPNNAVGSSTKYILDEMNTVCLPVAPLGYMDSRFAILTASHDRRLSYQGCSCGGRWVEGMERTVDAKKDCTEAERTQDKPFYLCAIVIGLPGYVSFRPDATVTRTLYGSFVGLQPR
jgi:hypothetical protein